jgi:hypothetical protein
VLAYRLHQGDQAHLVPGVTVEHPRLDGVFAWIAAQQRGRDAAHLANPKLTLRTKICSGWRSSCRIPGSHEQRGGSDRGRQRNGANEAAAIIARGRSLPVVAFLVMNVSASTASSATC